MVISDSLSLIVIHHDNLFLVLKDDLHLGVALGFAAVMLLVFFVIGAIYHKRITKVKRRHEYESRMYTVTAMAHDGRSSPDHVYQSVPKFGQTQTFVRPVDRKPLQTVYVDGNLNKPDLPPRSSPDVHGADAVALLGAVDDHPVSA